MAGSKENSLKRCAPRPGSWCEGEPGLVAVCATYMLGGEGRGEYGAMVSDIPLLLTSKVVRTTLSLWLL